MNYEIEQRPTYKREIRKLENSDPASAENTFNPLFSQIINNIEAVFQRTEEKLNKTATAVNASKLNNQPASYYATKSELDGVQSTVTQGLQQKLDKSGGNVTGSLSVDGDLVLGGPLVLPDRYKKKTASIPTSGWESVSGAYPKRYKLMVDGLKATDYLDIVIDKTSMAVAQKAELCPSVEESEGYAYIYAKKVPTSALSVSYKVVI